jgi:hypothetical protein
MKPVVSTDLMAFCVARKQWNGVQAHEVSSKIPFQKEMILLFSSFTPSFHFFICFLTGHGLR